MGTRGNAIATGFVLLAAVLATTPACETQAPLPGNGPAAQPASGNDAPVKGATAGAPGGANAGTGGANAGTGGANAGMGGAPGALPPSPAVVQEVMSRWNLAVASSNATIDFHWQEVNEFPHPTFKGGTAQAYGQFASILLAFFQSGDNFDFLAQNHLFTMVLRDDTLSGQGGVVTSFEQLADSFSASNAFGDITPEVHDGLVQVAQRIHQL